MTQPRFKSDRLKAAKRYVWELYSHKKWFCGAIYRTEGEESERVTVGIDILIDPVSTDRMTLIGEHEGVPVYYRHWNPEVDGERYDAGVGLRR